MSGFFDLLKAVGTAYALGKGIHDTYKRNHPPKPTFSQRLVNGVTSGVQDVYHKGMERGARINSIREANGYDQYSDARLVSEMTKNDNLSQDEWLAMRSTLYKRGKVTPKAEELMTQMYNIRKNKLKKR